MGWKARQTGSPGTLSKTHLLLPGGSHIVRECAREVVTRHRASLPDLSHVIILLPHTIQAIQMRHYLLRFAEETTNSPALIPPTITTPFGLFQSRYPQSAYIPLRQCKLLLGASLYEHRNLLIGFNCWEAADCLLALFDEINELNTVQETSLPLREESEIIAEIQTAWENIIDKSSLEKSAYVEALLRGKLHESDKSLFLCGFDSLSPAEKKWIARPESQQSLTIIEHDNSETEIGQMLAAAAEQKPIPLGERAAALTTRIPQSPLSGKVSVFAPENLEQHAFGVQLKIVELLKTGVKDIAVVTQDRKFARRLRAVLARRDIPVRDYSGWALSTTSCATALLHLVQRTAADYTHETLFNLLHSPYCEYRQNTQDLETLRQQFKRVVFSSPYADGSIEETINKIENSSKESAELLSLVSTVADTLRGLRQLCADTGEKPPAVFIDCLLDAMKTLGMEENFEQDRTAGQQILNTLDQMREAAEREKIKITWPLFRSWLTHTLETRSFVPDIPVQGVAFYNLNQSVLLHAEALILAALDHRYEQAGKEAMLLNDVSREKLGLNNKKTQTALVEIRFRRLLESADQILITHQTKDGTHTLTKTTWLEKLLNFHQTTYGSDLLDHKLTEAARKAARTEINPAKLPLPAPMQMPAFPARLSLWPEKLSVSDYQSAVRCPYQFFSHAGLKLKHLRTKPPEYQEPALYGQMIHHCLRALHTDLEGFPGPMDKPWVEQNQEYAQKLADDIITQSFTAKTMRNYETAWCIHEAKQIMKNYIQWLMESEYGSAEFSVEQMQTKALPRLNLHGYPDCVIHTEKGVQIVDYKTGTVPTKKRTMNGEDVQIGTYALFFPNTIKASYLQIKGKEKISAKWIENEPLAEIQQKHLDRLTEFKDDYDKQTGLYAWAEQNVCEWCDYSGICRRDAWANKQR